MCKSKIKKPIFSAVFVLSNKILEDNKSWANKTQQMVKTFYYDWKNNVIYFIGKFS